MKGNDHKDELQLHKSASEPAVMNSNFSSLTSSLSSDSGKMIFSTAKLHKVVFDMFQSKLK